MNFLPLAIDTSAITSNLTELATGGGVVIAAAIAVSMGFFGIQLLWRKGRKAVS